MEGRVHQQSTLGEFLQLLLPFLVIGMFIVSFLLLPSCRYYAIYYLAHLKLLEAKLVADRTSVELLQEFLTKLQQFNPEEFPFSAFRYGLSIVMEISYRTSLIIGILISIITLGISGLFVYRLRQKEKFRSPQEIIEEYKNKSFEEVAREYGYLEKVSDDPINDDPIKMALAFAELRKKRNVPPNVLARKLPEGSPQRLALFWWQRVVEKEPPEVLKPIKTHVELQEWLEGISSVKGESQDIEELQKKVEVALSKDAL